MGEVFAGRYELLDLIGEGGMGSVWRVHDRREDRIVAAKVLRQSDAVSLLRFVREQAVRVRHPHVVTPLGWAGEDDRVLFTMPVVDGGSIATLVGDHGALPPLLVAELMRQLLDALSAVHAAQLVHRDVKPGNVLLAATGPGRPHAYLTDFGIAVDLNGPRLTQTGHWSGTLGYAAPESLRGAEPSPAEDLYSAGLVGLAMLVGTRPTPPIARPAGVPDALWRLLDDLVQEDPDARPASAEEAVSRLDTPALAWSEMAMGSVEVLRQVEEVVRGESAGSVDEATTVRRPPDRTPDAADVAVQAAPVPGAPRSEAVHAGRAPDGSDGWWQRPWLPLLVLPVATLVLVLWSPWSGDPPGTIVDPTPSTGTTRPTGAVSSSSVSPTTASPTSDATTLPQPTGGTVGVGTVVVRVGQPCGFAEVGVRETTVGGIAVVCQRTTDGSYAWERP